ncbi:MAG: PilW family protein [Betaproteobacteria bacterium]|nr:PilW family protein [Betaproteobacteria bacterium]
MDTHSHSPSRRSSHVRKELRAGIPERGFTLIELMVAVVIGLLVLGTVAVVFAGTSRNGADLERASRLAGNVHYALEMLTEEMRLAGYFAEMSFVGVAWQVPDPCATTTDAQGWSRAPFTAPVALAGFRRADPSPACVADRRPGTAILALRRASVVTTLPAAASAAPHLQVSKCRLDPSPWVVSDRPADFTLRNLDCATVADVRQLLVRTYFVANCNDCGVDSIPTLKRAELVGGEIVVTPLVEGVEDIQIEYGFDADGDGNPDRYLDFPDAAIAPAYGDWSNVMAARLFVLLRSTDRQPGYLDATKRFNLGEAGYTPVANDGFRRLLLSSVVRINNPAGQRETP